MVGYLKRMSWFERVLLVLLLAGLLGLLGALVWDYPTWPITVLIALCAVLNVIQGARRTDAAPPQANDPNRR